MDFKQKFKDQFTKKSNFLFDTERPAALITFDWKIPHVVYLVYKTLFMGWFVGSLCYIYRAGVDIAAYTTWSFFAITIQTFIHFIVLFYYTFHPPHKVVEGWQPAMQHEERTKTPIGLKIFWGWTAFSYTAAVFVVIVYNTVLHSFGSPYDYENFITHIMNGLYVIIDVFVSGIEVRFCHVVYIFVYTMVYCIFNGIYFAATGTVVYSFLDWTNPLVALYIPLLMILLAVVHFMVFGWGFLRAYLAYKATPDRWGDQEKQRPPSSEDGEKREEKRPASRSSVGHSDKV